MWPNYVKFIIFYKKSPKIFVLCFLFIQKCTVFVNTWNCNYFKQTICTVFDNIVYALFYMHKKGRWFAQKVYNFEVFKKYKFFMHKLCPMHTFLQTNFEHFLSEKIQLHGRGCLSVYNNIFNIGQYAVGRRKLRRGTEDNLIRFHYFGVYVGFPANTCLV